MTRYIIDIVSKKSDVVCPHCGNATQDCNHLYEVLERDDLYGGVDLADEINWGIHYDATAVTILHGVPTYYYWSKHR